MSRSHDVRTLLRMIQGMPVPVNEIGLTPEDIERAKQMSADLLQGVVHRLVCACGAPDCRALYQHGMTAEEFRVVATVVGNVVCELLDQVSDAVEEATDHPPN